jgi:hypothetical protein
LSELLVYALGGQAPSGFVARLIGSQHLWDDEFRRRLEELAYEFRPDLAIWEIQADEDGVLMERRTAPVLDLLDDGAAGNAG